MKRREKKQQLQQDMAEQLLTKKKDPNFINSSKMNFRKVNSELEDDIYAWMKNEVVGLGIDDEDDHHYFLSGIDCSAISGMENAVNSMAKEILRSYEQNVTSNFIKYVERFVNVIFQKQEKLDAIEVTKDTKEVKKNKKNQLINDLRKLKNDLLSIDSIDKLESSDDVAKEFVLRFNLKHCILPNKTRYNHQLYYYNIQ